MYPNKDVVRAMMRAILEMMLLTLGGGFTAFVLFSTFHDMKGF